MRRISRLSPAPHLIGVVAESPESCRYFPVITEKRIRSSGRLERNYVACASYKDCTW